MAYILHKIITTINRTFMNNKVNKYIVLHYTGNRQDAAKNNANYFKSTYRGASAQYFVDKTTVYQVVEDKDAAWAVGKNYGSNNLFGIVTNNNSINIEMCSDNGAIAEETFKNTVELTKTLMKKYNIPPSNVYRHFDVCSKKCPGWTGWVGTDESIWNRFKSEISNNNSSSMSSSSSSIPSSSTISRKYAVGQAVTYSSCYKSSVDGVDKAISCNPYKTGIITKVLTTNVNNPYLINNGTCWLNDGDIRSIGGTSQYTPNSSNTHYSKTQFIKDIQKAVGTKVNGIAGSETYRKCPTVSKLKNNKHAVVKPLQKYLNAQGYNCGDADGVAGIKFDSAAKAWAKSNGCTADGEFTRNGRSWKKILGLI